MNFSVCFNKDIQCGAETTQGHLSCLSSFLPKATVLRSDQPLSLKTHGSHREVMLQLSEDHWLSQGGSSLVAAWVGSATGSVRQQHFLLPEFLLIPPIFFFSLPEASQDDRNGRFRHGFSAVSSVVAYCHLHSSNHQWLYMLICPGRAELTLLRIAHCYDFLNSALSYSNCSQPPPSTYCKTILP